jgi:hypothetical protein
MKKLISIMLLTLVMIPFATAATRSPILEDFTAATCGYCPPSDAQFEACIAAWPTQMLGIGYHCNWPSGGDVFYNFASGCRVAYYGVSGIPAGFVDGVETSYSNYYSTVAARMAVSAPISISLSGTYNITMRQAHVIATVTADSAMTGSGHMIYITVLEDNLSALGRSFNRVERAVNANGWGESFSIASGETKTYTYNFNINTGWKQEDLKLGCWVQSNSATGKQLQNSKQDLFSVLEVVEDVQPTSLGSIKANYR